MSQYGFTGTRSGMSDPQKMTFADIVYKDVPEVLRIGCCIGADTDAAIIYKRCMHGIRQAYRIIGHPGKSAKDGDTSCRSEEAVKLCCELMEEKTHFARNKDIVNMSQVLVATPWQTKMTAQGGTWHTINFALKCRHTVLIIWPDGRLEQL